MNINSLRGQLLESGIAAAKGAGRAGEPIEKAGSEATLPEPVKMAVKAFAELLKAIKAQIEKRDEQIAQAHRQSETSRLLAAIPGGSRPRRPQPACLIPVRSSPARIFRPGSA